MIEGLGLLTIQDITLGNLTITAIDLGTTRIWPDSSTGPTPSHVYSFYIQNYSTDTVNYTGGTLIIYIASTCDGAAEELSYTVVENGSTPSWISLLQRQAVTGQPYNWVYYFGISSNSGSLRHAGFTFTQNGSGNTATLSITQLAYTTAFDGMTIKARRTSEYGYWVIGTVDNGMGGPPPTYPNRAVVIATDQPITSTRRISYTLTAKRLKDLATPSLGNAEITLNLTQTISSGSTVKPDSSSSGKTYYGAYVILTDTSFSNGTWTNTPGTHTTMSPYPSQDVSDVTITNVFIS